MKTRAIVYECRDGSFVAIATKNKKFLETVENALYDSKHPAPMTWTDGVGTSFEEAVAQALFNAVRYDGEGRVCGNCGHYQPIRYGLGLCCAGKEAKLRQPEKNYRCRHFF